jgi:tRNA(Ile)-lysidine synthase
MHLLHAFQDYIAKERLFSPEDRLLLAVSGGIDSVVLCELAQQAGFQFELAHCNFQLRGAESDRDEQFVSDLAGRHGREIHVQHFDTAAIALSRKVSVQVAARDLRYEWFHRILAADDRPGLIVTAHQLDDNIETQLMNFFKGTGIAGLRGMLPRQGKIVRPLLFADRAAIRRFAGELGLRWVEDSSNETDRYTRNFFRHRILPLLEEAYPAALQNLAANLERFRGIETVYRQAIEQQKSKLLEYRGGWIHIPVEKLKRASPLSTLIFEIFSPFGFTPQQSGPIEALLDSVTGKYVLSATHRVLRNRNWLILSPLRDPEATVILIEAGESLVEFSQGVLGIEKIAPAGYPPPADTSVAWLDARGIEYPLILRPWSRGDYFYPLGMRKKKKLARFFIDQKLSLAEKEKVWVLETNKKILWVIGRRIDDRFRTAPGTSEQLKISFTARG